MSSSVTVNVYGPNLDDQSLGDIHIHKAGCNHPAPLEGDLPAEVLSISADSKREILDTVYPPDEFEDTSVDWLHWAACTRSIQREPSAPDTPTDLSRIAGWRGAAPNSPDTFRFVILSDRTGGHIPGLWAQHPTPIRGS